MALNLQGVRKRCLREEGSVRGETSRTFWNLVNGNLCVWLYAANARLCDWLCECVFECVLVCALLISRCTAHFLAHLILAGVLEQKKKQMKKLAAAFFPIRSQWSRKLKTFSLQSIKNNGRWQRNHSPSAKRRRMQSPVSSLQLLPPTPFCMGETVARIKLICMYVCLWVCAGIG